MEIPCLLKNHICQGFYSGQKAEGWEKYKQKAKIHQNFSHHIPTDQGATDIIIGIGIGR